MQRKTQAATGITVNAFTDPITVFRFAIIMRGVIVGWFTSCSGLTVERKVVERREGGVNDHVHQLPGPVSFSHITLKHGLADNALWSWFRAGLYDGKVDRRDVSIALYDSTLTDVRFWNIPDAYPVNWKGPELGSESDEIVVESVELASGGSSRYLAVQRAPARLIQSETFVPAAPEASEASAIDLPALAEKVYALMKHDLQIERERRGRVWQG